MVQNRLVATGIIGVAVSMLGLVTLALVACAAVGISGSTGWLAYVLLPATAVFASLTIYAAVSRRRHQRLSR
jgi:hypothetical protein